MFNRQRRVTVFHRVKRERARFQPALFAFVFLYTDRNMEALADPVYAKKVMDSIPVGFYGEPEDCAGIVELLCSDKGRYITGQSIYVDGGKSL